MSTLRRWRAAIPAEQLLQRASPARGSRSGRSACSSPSARSAWALTIWYWLSYLRGPSDDAVRARAVPAARERQRGRAALERARRQGRRAHGARPRTARPSRSPAASCAACSRTPATRGSRASRAPPRRAARSSRRPRRSTARCASPCSATTARATTTSGRSAGCSPRSGPTSSSPPGDNSYLVAAEVLLDRNIFRPLADLMAQRADVRLPRRPRQRSSPGRAPSARRSTCPRAAASRCTTARSRSSCSATSPTIRRRIEFARTELHEPGPAVRFVACHRPLQIGDPILPLLRETGAIVFSGHLHRYERRTVEGVQTFTVGTERQGARARSSTRRRRPARDVSLLDIGALMVDVRADGVGYTYLDQQRQRPRPRRDLSACEACLIVLLTLAACVLGLIAVPEIAALLIAHARHAASRSCSGGQAGRRPRRSGARRPDRRRPAARRDRFRLHADRGRRPADRRTLLALALATQIVAARPRRAARACARPERAPISARTMARCPHRSISPPTPPACGSPASNSPPRCAPPPSRLQRGHRQPLQPRRARPRRPLPAQSIRPALVGDARERPAHDRSRRRAPRRARGQLDTTAFTIHLGAHRARPDAACVLHTHMPYATALSHDRGRPRHAR